MSALARAAVRRLRTGVVPEWELERLSVGYGHLKRLVRSALKSLAREGTSGPVFVRGEWGSGKSHFLSYVRAMAKAHGIPSSRVNLNARSAALNYPQRFFGPAMGEVRFEGRMGLRPVILSLLENPANRTAMTAFARSAAAGDLAGPLAKLCARYEWGDTLDIGADSAWSLFLGGDLSWADYSYKRHQAVARIQSVGRLLSAAGMSGLVLLFDEAETIHQLWNIRSRIVAYDVIAELSRMKTIWCVFGITDRFDHTIAADLQAGILNAYGITPAAASFLKAWQRQEYESVEPPAIETGSACTLAGLVATLYDEAYDLGGGNGRTVDKCLAEWVTNPSRNPRRLIRLLIHRLDLNRSLNPSEGSHFA